MGIKECNFCGEYHWADAHHDCLPRFFVWCPDFDQGPEDSRAVYATNMEEAVEKWADESDSKGDYTIISGGGANVMAYKEGFNEDSAVKFEVTGEAIPIYHAKLALDTE